MLTIRRAMRALAVKPALAMLALLALACQKPDVGAPCTLQWGADASTPRPTPTTARADYFQTGNLACDDRVCIVSPAAADSSMNERSGKVSRSGVGTVMMAKSKPAASSYVEVGR